MRGWPGEFEGAAAVVTGAAAGIGREFARALGRRGARVVLADLDQAGADQTAALVRRSGGEAFVVGCDVRRRADVEALVDATRARVGVPDLVVLNAGVLVAGPLVRSDAEALERMVEVNVLGVLHGCRAFAPAMIERGRGRLLNVASLAGLVPTPQLAAYAATKAAVVGLSEALHAELRPHGVGVTVLCPSFTRTGLVARAAGSDRAMQSLGQRIIDAMGAQPERVARAGLRAAAAGRLYAVDTLHARVAWGLKRAAPRLLAQLAARASARLDRSPTG